MIKTGEYSPVMNELLNLIVDGKMDTISRTNLLSSKRLHINDIKYESVRFYIDYANVCLLDDVITEEEMRDVVLLRRFLNIKHKDFNEYGYDYTIREILKQQLRKMYADDRIDKNEAIMKVNLQGLFDFSYDDFLVVVNEFAKESIERGADIKNLDTFIPQ